MEKFIVSARKYRPASFADVVGQSSITTTLRNSILNNHLGHAYLFSGPRGVGKTTCARIFAKTINCFNITESGEACEECESCQSFNENRSYSIHELDAASNNSVDDIRTLTEQVRIPPQIGSYSIYIIDEVHMLSQSAFNAFLKTLEEPPAHAIFVLATTEKHKIIPTILSRCQIFDFNRIKVEDAVEYLKQIADREQLKYEEDALNVIARKADGAMRDALSIFDQVVSFSGEKITYQDVIQNLNILDYEYFFKLTFFLLAGDIASAMLLFDEILSKGFDSRNFINGYAAHLRDLMVCKNPETVQLMEVGAGIREKYLEQSKEVTLPFLYSGLEICNQADIEIRSSRNQRLTIELALVRLANLSEVSKKKAVTEPAAEKSESTEAVTEPAAEANGTLETASGQPGEAHQSIETEPVVEQTPGGAEGDRTAAAAPAQEPVQGTRSENSVSSLVRTPGISIKQSLRGTPAQAVPADSRPSEPEDRTLSEPEETTLSEPEESTLPEEDEPGFPDPDTIIRAWNKYASSMEKSKPRIYSTLIHHKPEVKADGSIKVLLNSEAQRDHFVKHIRKDLLRFIQDATGFTGVEIITDVSESAQNGSKIYTEQDKLDFLVGKNPELGKLKSRFNLDFDD